MKKTIVSLLLIVTMLLTVIPPAMAEPDDPPTGQPEQEESAVIGEETTETDPAEETADASKPEETEKPTDADEPEETEKPTEPEEIPAEPGSEEASEEPPEEAAEETEEAALMEIGEIYTLTVGDDMFPASNDALFTRYVDQMFRSGDPNAITFPKNKSLPDPHEVLNDQQYAVEQSLKSTIQAIARGSRYETQIDIILSRLNLTYDTARRIDMEQVFHTLLLDCTYELYWFGRQVSWGFASESKMTVYLYVAEDYAADDTRLKVKSSAISAAVAAVRKTSSIITSAAALSDVEKLRAYKNEICRLTEYNMDAAYTDMYDGQEGPWSLVWVFDGDPATNVVCEGYAKAFEYLCNHSTFRSSLINCYCASGAAVFPNDATGPHMWNIVTMDDGRNYVIDATNCDEGDTGNNNFFLCYGLEGDPQQGYLLSCTALYAYDATTLAACSDRARTLASTPYQGAPGDVKITGQPQDQRVSEGQEATFTVTATGSGLTYQWYCLPPTDYTWQTMYGETEPTLTVTAQADMDGTFYYCLVTGSSGRRPSESAVLEVLVPPAIVKQPEDAEVIVNTPMPFAVEASGTHLSYQWYYSHDGGESWSKVSDSSSDYTLNGRGPTYQAKALSGYDQWQFYCEISNDLKTVTTDAVTLTVISTPSIFEGPIDANVLPGEEVIYHIVAQGYHLAYQWYCYNVKTDQSQAIPSATSDTYRLVAETDMDGNQYWCNVSNEAGTSSSSRAALHVITELPKINVHPSDENVKENQWASFIVLTSGYGLTFQWYCFDGETEFAIEGATKSSYGFTGTKELDGNQYWCEVKNAMGSVFSNRATLNVFTVPVIEVDLQNVTVKAGETATFTLSVTGKELTYYWKYTDNKNILNLTDVHTNTYSFTATAEQDGYTFWCVISNFAGNVESYRAKLTVLPADATPSPSPTPTPTATATASPTPSPTASASASPTATATASPSPTATASASPSPTPTAPAGPTPSPTPYTPPSGENVIRFGPDELPAGQMVEVDGVSYPLGEDGTVLLPDGVQAHIVTEYTYNKVSQDPHEVYPTAMRVWRVTVTNDEQVAQRVPELDDVLQYSGSSIRITGNKGIRMITSVPKDKKKSLTARNGLSGWTLLEYGTVVAWDSELNGDALTLDHPAAKQAFAYKKGQADPIFKDTGKLIQYTNVLVGMTNEKCVPDLAMRPYMILESPAKIQVKLYGGTIHRSIGYIAYQNRTAFQPGTAAYKFIWEIIHFVYGDAYDADYRN